MNNRIDTKRKLKSIFIKQDMMDILDKVLLSERERQVAVMFYIEKKQMMDIADELMVSEATVLKDHAKILDKISEVL